MSNTGQFKKIYYYSDKFMTLKMFLDDLRIVHPSQESYDQFIFNTFFNFNYVDKYTIEEILQYYTNLNAYEYQEKYIIISICEKLLNMSISQRLVFSHLYNSSDYGLSLDEFNRCVNNGDIDKKIIDFRAECTIKCEELNKYYSPSFKYLACMLKMLNLATEDHSILDFINAAVSNDCSTISRNDVNSICTGDNSKICKCLENMFKFNMSSLNIEQRITFITLYDAYKDTDLADISRNTFNMAIYENVITKERINKLARKYYIRT